MKMYGTKRIEWAKLQTNYGFFRIGIKKYFSSQLQSTILLRINYN